MSNFDWSRFKNYGLWVSILALIPLLLDAAGVTIVPEQYQLIANTILSMLVTLGVVSNPTTTTKWFGDDSGKIVELPAEKQVKEENK